MDDIQKVLLSLFVPQTSFFSWVIIILFPSVAAACTGLGAYPGGGGCNKELSHHVARLDHWHFTGIVGGVFLSNRASFLNSPTTISCCGGGCFVASFVSVVEMEVLCITCHKDKVEHTCYYSYLQKGRKCYGAASFDVHYLPYVASAQTCLPNALS